MVIILFQKMRFYFLISIFGVCHGADKAGARKGWKLFTLTKHQGHGPWVMVWCYELLMLLSTFKVPMRIYTNFCLNEASLEEMPIFLLAFGIEWPEQIECGWGPEWTMQSLQCPSVVQNLDSGIWLTILKPHRPPRFVRHWLIGTCRTIHKKKEFEAI